MSVLTVVVAKRVARVPIPVGSNGYLLYFRKTFNVQSIFTVLIFINRYLSIVVCTVLKFNYSL